MKHAIAGFALALLGASMTFSSPLSAQEPGYACTAQNEGNYDSVYIGGWEEGYLYIYQCSNSQWHLVEVQYCTFQSGCSPS